MTNFGGAPVCSQPTSTPTQQNNPVGAIPAIPPAQANMTSILATVRALTQAVQQLAGFIGGQVNNAGIVETSRTTQTVRVFRINKDGSVNRNQFIDVRRISALNMQDKKSKEKWTFKGNYNDGNNVEVIG
jgi:hypothetical protein